MKLYLTSYRIPAAGELLKLVGKPANEIKVAFIPNAQDFYAKRARNVKTRETIEYLEGLGLKAELLDLWDYDEPAKIKEALSKYNLIWAKGGNTFCLRYEMQRSGFDQIIRDLLENTDLVYAGESAGACVVGTTLEGIEAADNPEYAEGVIIPGLNLLPNIILPHVDNQFFADDIEYARRLHGGTPELIELTDSQALIVDGDQQRIVTGSKQ